MIEYHKIQTVFSRDPDTNYKTLIMGQYASEAFHYLASNQWVFTEKVDGTNIRVIFDGIYFHYKGKSDKAQIPQFLMDRLQETFELKQKLFKEKFPDGVCLYGEGYGAKIQKGGGNYRPDQGFVLFDVRISDWWLNRPNVEEIAQAMDLEIVPVIGKGTLEDMVVMVQSLKMKSMWGDFLPEGIVARPACELYDRNGKRIITKLKLKDFPKET